PLPRDIGAPQHGEIETAVQRGLGGETAAAPKQIAQSQFDGWQTWSSQIGLQSRMYTVRTSRQGQAGHPYRRALGSGPQHGLSCHELSFAVAIIGMARKSHRPVFEILPQRTGQRRI